MTVPYLVRLLCISLAAFYLVHLAVAAAVSLAAPAIVRFAGRLRPNSAARFLFAVRLLPAVFAVLIVGALCIPSYLWLETERAEEVGSACMALAALGLAVWTVSLGRSLQATWQSRRYAQHCERAGRRAEIGGRSAVWIIDRDDPFLMLAGILRPHLVISRAVASALTEEQLAAALDHEQAHWSSRDNLKRLAILVAPGIAPFFHGFTAIEQAWARFAEWSADDRAVAGDSSASLSLASALVRVARMGVQTAPHPLVTSLLADGRDLSERVDRLLHPAPMVEARRTFRRAPIAVAGMALLALSGMSAPAVLRSVHSMLEYLVH